MNFFNKFFLSIGLVWLISFISFSQSFEWNTGFHGFLDNREYFNKYSNDQTMFGSRLFANAGFAIDEENRFMAGFSYTYEFGSKDNLIKPDITLFYNYQKSINFYLGAFPRQGLVDQPQFLLSDTLNYYKPNIEGLFLEVRKDWGYQNIWMDWTGRQSVDRKESFLVGISGRYQKSRIYFEHHISFYHFALPLNPGPDEHIQDNGGLIATLGLDLSKSTFFDSLRFSSGIAFSYDRLRFVYDLKTPLGWYSDLLVKYKTIGLHSTLYWGDKHSLLNGDQLYKSGSYQRFDLFYQSRGNKRISAKIQFSVHLLPKIVDYSQMFIIYVNFGGKHNLKNENLTWLN